MREGLGSAAQHLSQGEADAVASSPVLLPAKPARPVVVLAEAARGGVLWVGIAAALATRQGRHLRVELGRCERPKLTRIFHDADAGSEMRVCGAQNVPT